MNVGRVLKLVVMAVLFTAVGFAILSRIPGAMQLITPRSA